MSRWNYHLMGSDYAQEELGELTEEIFKEYFPDKNVDDMWEILGTEEAHQVFQDNSDDIVMNYYSFALPFFLMNMGVRVSSNLYDMLMDMTKHSAEYQFKSIDKTYEEYLKYFILDEFTDEDLLQMIQKNDKKFNNNLAKTIGSGLSKKMNNFEDNGFTILDDSIEALLEEYDAFDEDEKYEDALEQYEEDEAYDDEDYNLFNWQERTDSEQ